MASTFREFLPTSDDDGKRIDVVLRRVFPDLPLGRIHRALRKGDVRSAGRRLRTGDRVAEGVPIQVSAYLGTSAQSAETAASAGVHVSRGRPADHDARASAAETILRPLIVFENAHLLVVNKPRGMAVQGGFAGATARNVLDGLVREYLSRKIPASLSFRPGPLNRIDRNTSGLVFFSVSVNGARRFSAHLRSRGCAKYYIALLCGKLEQPAVWEDSLVRDDRSRRSRVGHAGKLAVTAVAPLAFGSGERPRTLVLCSISTGVTHQIRAQAASHGHPLCGDRKYGATEQAMRRYVLHAWRYSLPAADPVLGFETVSAPLDTETRELVEAAVGHIQARHALAHDNLESAILQLPHL